MTTGIIPVAGQGSRLGMDRPKALVEIGGRTLLSYVLDALSPMVDSLVLVVMPEAEIAFQNEIRALGWTGSMRILVQTTPSGSADAVGVAVQAIPDEEACVLVWGDQVGVSRQTVARVTTALDDGFLGIVLPLTEVDTPYVWYAIDGDVVKVGRRRDGDISPLRGMSDVGTFGFLAGQVRPWLAFDGFKDHDGQRETDFVYVVPQLAASDGIRVIDVRDASETLGVNDPSDLERARLHLSASPR
jgi:CTP:molybdopterin cytidylyltransferase MocA